MCVGLPVLPPFCVCSLGFVLRFKQDGSNTLFFSHCTVLCLFCHRFTCTCHYARHLLSTSPSTPFYILLQVSTPPPALPPGVYLPLPACLDSHLLAFTCLPRSALPFSLFVWITLFVFHRTTDSLLRLQVPGPVGSTVPHLVGTTASFRSPLPLHHVPRFWFRFAPRRFVLVSFWTAPAPSRLYAYLLYLPTEPAFCRCITCHLGLTCLHPAGCLACRAACCHLGVSSACLLRCFAATASPFLHSPACHLPAATTPHCTFPAWGLTPGWVTGSFALHWIGFAFSAEDIPHLHTARFCRLPGRSRFPSSAKCRWIFAHHTGYCSPAAFYRLPRLCFLPAWVPRLSAWSARFAHNSSAPPTCIGLPFTCHHHCTAFYYYWTWMGFGDTVCAILVFCSVFGFRYIAAYYSWMVLPLYFACLPFTAAFPPHLPPIPHASRHYTCLP